MSKVFALYDADALDTYRANQFVLVLNKVL